MKKAIFICFLLISQLVCAQEFHWKTLETGNSLPNIVSGGFMPGYIVRPCNSGALAIIRGGDTLPQISKFSVSRGNPSITTAEIPPSFWLGLRGNVLRTDSLSPHYSHVFYIGEDKVFVNAPTLPYYVSGLIQNMTDEGLLKWEEVTPIKRKSLPLEATQGYFIALYEPLPCPSFTAVFGKHLGDELFPTEDFTIQLNGISGAYRTKHEGLARFISNLFIN